MNLPERAAEVVTLSALIVAWLILLLALFQEAQC